MQHSLTQKQATAKKRQKGFTLIELIMVIVILGILAAIAVPQFVDLSGDAQDAADKGNLNAAKSAMSMLMASGAHGAGTAGVGVFPSVTELANNLGVTGDAIAVDGFTPEGGKKILTFSDVDCSTVTADLAATPVKCIKLAE